MSIFTKIFSGGAKEVIGAVGGVLDNLITNKEELAAAKLAIESEVNRHMEVVEANATKQIELQLEDIANARAMQMAALGQQDNFSKRFLYYLAGVIIFFTMTYGVLLFFLEIPESNKRLIEMFLDIFVFSGSLSVIYFFFGSSKSSHDKSDTIAAGKETK